MLYNYWSIAFLFGRRGAERAEGLVIFFFDFALFSFTGRTFPNHPYFAPPLGHGQLCLFNILKAYSILDEEVGYCQGLSFVAGILLMHMKEEDAYDILRFMMYTLGVRKQYKPDMQDLQVNSRSWTVLQTDLHCCLILFLRSYYKSTWFIANLLFFFYYYYYSYHQQRVKIPLLQSFTYVR